jgi:hypothetical protein
MVELSYQTVEITCIKNMMAIEMNWIAILVAAIINFFIGYLWYGPLFGAAWRREMKVGEPGGLNMGGAPMGQLLAVSFLGSIVMAYVLRHIVGFGGIATGDMSALGGAMGGVWTWLGTIAVYGLNSVLYERRSWTFYFINVSYYLVSFAIMGALLAVWI